MNELAEFYVTESDLAGAKLGAMERAILKSMAQNEQRRLRRDFVLMAWSLVFAFGLALAVVAEPLHLQHYLSRELSLWIMGLVGVVGLITLGALLLQFRVLREHASDIALRNEVERRLEQMDRKPG